MLVDSSTTARCGAPTIDLEQVVHRGSRRRSVRKAAVGGATTLAIAGIGVASIAGIRGTGDSPAILSRPGSFSPVRCSSADESEPGVPDDLPPVAPRSLSALGRYQPSVAISVLITDKTGAALSELATGALSEVILR